MYRIVLIGLTEVISYLLRSISICGFIFEYPSHPPCSLFRLNGKQSGLDGLEVSWGIQPIKRRTEDWTNERPSKSGSLPSPASGCLRDSLHDPQHQNIKSTLWRKSPFSHCKTCRKSTRLSPFSKCTQWNES